MFEVEVLELEEHQVTRPLTRLHGCGMVYQATMIDPSRSFSQWDPRLPGRGTLTDT
jgi:hypothetical protein